MSYTCGFVYVVNTESYLREAMLSLASLRICMPNASVAIVTHEELFVDDPSVIWIPLTQSYDSPIVKWEAVRCPFDRFIFLDSDTRVLRELSELFTCLDAFDCALAHEPTRGWDYSSSASPPFCELNTGVMAFKKSEAVIEFFRLWRNTYETMRIKQHLLNDQPSFREVLWDKRDIRLCTLPSEFHLVTGRPASITWHAHVLHGRNNLDALSNIVNEAIAPRAFVPVYGVFPGYSGRRCMIKTWLQFTKQVLRTLTSPNGAAADPSPGDWERRAAAKGP